MLPDLSLEDTALFYARAGIAAYDASIAGWKVGHGTNGLPVALVAHRRVTVTL